MCLKKISFSEFDLKISIDVDGFIDFGDIFWLKTIDFWTDSLRNHGYIGNFDWTELCDYSMNFYVLIRDRYLRREICNVG